MERPVLDPMRQKKASEYARTMRHLWSTQIALSILFLTIILFSGLSAYLRDILNLPLLPQATIYFVILLATFKVVLFPLGYYQGFILPHRYGLSSQEFRGWFVDKLKGTLLEMFVGIVVIATTYWLLQYFQR